MRRRISASLSNFAARRGKNDSGTSRTQFRYGSMCRLFLLPLLLLAACDALPRDPHNTLNNIYASRQIRVGLVAGTKENLPAGVLIAALTKETKSKAAVISGPVDPLLARLNGGSLDLVIGPFARNSPLADQVAFGPALSILHGAPSVIEVKAAMRNGENRWIMSVERASRRIILDATNR